MVCPAPSRVPAKPVSAVCPPMPVQTLLLRSRSAVGNSFQISGILCSFFGKPCQFCRRSDLIYAVLLLRHNLGRFALPSVVVLFRIVGFHSPVLPCQHRISAVDPIGICCKAVAQSSLVRAFSSSEVLAVAVPFWIVQPFRLPIAVSYSAE